MATKAGGEVPLRRVGVLGSTGSPAAGVAAVTPEGGNIGGTVERCVFCLGADGTQYVPLHLDEEGEELAFGPALAAHCACAPCWSAWERRRLTVDCPVCLRPVDVRRGYPGGDLCAVCLAAVVLTGEGPSPRTAATRRPRARRRCCCRCGSCGCTFGVVVLLCVFGAAAQLVQRAVLLAAVDHAAGFADLAVSLRVVPPHVRALLCPGLELLGSLASGTDPVIRVLLELGFAVCGPADSAALGGSWGAQWRASTRGKATAIKAVDKGAGRWPPAAEAAAASVAPRVEAAKREEL